jgi:hypothetical protein
MAIRFDTNANTTQMCPSQFMAISTLFQIEVIEMNGNVNNIICTKLAHLTNS